MAGSQFFPVAAGTWSGSGVYQALGGTWNTSTHAFTVSQTLISTSGTPVTIDLAQQQRVFVGENTNDWTAAASFLAKTGTGNAFDFTATAVDGSDLNALNTLLEPGQSVLSSWNFTATGSGYNPYDPIYLSLGIPLNLSRTDLRLWRFSSGNWSSYTAADLTSASGYAGFLITGLSGYAVTASLPTAAWIADADGIWQNGSNWTTAPNAPGGVNVAAVLGPVITSPRTVTLVGPLTLGVLTFDSLQHYTLAGSDSLNFQVNPGYEAQINVLQSDPHGHVIEAPLTLSSPLDITIAPATSLTLDGQVQNPSGLTLTLSGGGTLRVTQGIVTTGVVNVQVGTLITPGLTAGTLNIGQSVTSAAAVPEPSAWVLLIAGVVGVCIRMFRNVQSMP